jgi:hypothetical protein
MMLYTPWLSAQPNYFLIDKVNIAGLANQHEFKLELSVKPQFADNFGLNISPTIEAAYSPIEHLVVIASYHSIINRQELTWDWFTPVALARVDGYLLEAGLGYTTWIGRYGHSEITVNYGNSMLRRRDVYDDYHFTTSSDFNASYHSICLQPSIGIKEGRASVDGGVRYMFRSCYNYSVQDAGSATSFKNSNGFLGTFINFEAGGDLIRYNMQTGFSGVVQGNIYGDDVAGYMTIGISLHLSGPEKKGSYLNY